MTDHDTDDNNDTDRTRLIVAGSRSITEFELLRRIFIRGGRRPQDAPTQYEIVSGGAAGVDTLGEQFAEQYQIPLTTPEENPAFDPDWATHGKAAGPIRNREMAKYSDVLIALWDGESRGTRNMINEALAHGLEIHVYRPENLTTDDTGPEGQ